MSLSPFGETLTGKGLNLIKIDQQLDGDARSFSAIVGDYSENCAEELANAWTNDSEVTGFEIRPQQA